MTSQELRYPHSFEERKPALHEGVLFVPKHYYQHQEWPMPTLASPEIFGNEHSVCIEYCSGNGQWICQKAAENPAINWIAVEMRFDRVKKIWARRKKMGLNNLFIVCGEAQTFTKYYLKDEVISSVYVNFPDPWPKDKHSRNRLFQEPFISDISRVVKQGGTTTVVTDDEVYSHQVITEMTQCPRWKATYPEPYYLNEWPDGEYGYSFFEELWLSKGKKIRYMQFTNSKL